VFNPTLTTRLDDRWPQGMVGRRDTRIIKNARIYLATGDGQVTKLAWGDLGLEQWHILREFAADGLVLVASENAPGMPLTWYHRSEAADATFDVLIPGLMLALDRDCAVLLNHPDPERHTLGAISLPAFGRQATRTWLKERLAMLMEPH
jgi:hypothetical protein